MATSNAPITVITVDAARVEVKGFRFIIDTPQNKVKIPDNF
ncbi:hypothetical protein CWATWH0003_4753 [Crocosphaera watsonii WH 0003]|uniref:Uncharacterized protein n=1 Tax=Crocosphaera watsonii WH 0003 TaxID=423471 RepID=G5JBD7_CROWT|nr:hypothetical protein CWATWH0003_4753 [Crocosphaera watsonii WH 0003]